MLAARRPWRASRFRRRAGAASSSFRISRRSAPTRLRSLRCRAARALPQPASEAGVLGCLHVREGATLAEHVAHLARGEERLYRRDAIGGSGTIPAEAVPGERARFFVTLPWART
jgi:hypothetical protein